MDEVRYILSLLSRAERDLFVSLGGHVPAHLVARAEPIWHEPPASPGLKEPTRDVREAEARARAARRAFGMDRPAPRPAKVPWSPGPVMPARRRVGRPGAAIQCVEDPGLVYASYPEMSDALETSVTSCKRAVAYGWRCRGRHWRPLARDAAA